MSFYQKSISIYLSPDYREQFWSSTQAHGQIESDLWRLELGPNDERIRKNVDPQNAILSEETFKLSTPNWYLNTPLFLDGVFDIVQQLE